MEQLLGMEQPFLMFPFLWGKMWKFLAGLDVHQCKTIERGETWSGLGYCTFQWKGTVGLHSRNLTKIPKIAIFEGSYLFQTIILGIHVSFQGFN